MALLSFKLNEHLYLKDPQRTELGQNIIKKSVDMIDQLGFEHFTFKKLALEIESTEASVYRYFENKHRLLHYLISWYWNWLEYKIDMAINSLKNPDDKLRAFLRIVAEKKKFDPTFEFINEDALYRIVMDELDKTFLTKWVDTDNEEGLFVSFKSLCKKIASLIKEINPKYRYPNGLISTTLLAAKQQHFFAEHLPSLTNLKNDRKFHQNLYLFLESLVFNTIKK